MHADPKHDRERVQGGGNSKVGCLNFPPNDKATGTRSRLPRCRSFQPCPDQKLGETEATLCFLAYPTSANAFSMPVNALGSSIVAGVL
jgi:hypothetical protein